MEKINKIYLASIIRIVCLCCIVAGVSFQVGRFSIQNNHETESIPVSNVNMTPELVFNAIDSLTIDIVFYNRTDNSTVQIYGYIEGGGFSDTLVMFEYGHENSFAIMVECDLNDFNQPNTIEVLQTKFIIEFKNDFPVILIKSTDSWFYDVEFGATICLLINIYDFVISDQNEVNQCI